MVQSMVYNYLCYRTSPPSASAKADPFASLGSLTGLKPKEAPAPKMSMGQMNMATTMTPSGNQSVPQNVSLTLIRVRQNRPVKFENWFGPDCTGKMFLAHFFSTLPNPDCQYLRQLKLYNLEF